MKIIFIQKSNISNTHHNNISLVNFKHKIFYNFTNILIQDLTIKIRCILSSRLMIKFYKWEIKMAINNLRKCKVIITITINNNLKNYE